MTDPATPDHVTGAGLPAEATGERPGPFSVFLKVLSAALSGGLVVLLFAAIIPKVTEFESVGESIKSIAPATVVLMLIMALAIQYAFYKLLRVPLPWGVLQGIAW